MAKGKEKAPEIALPESKALTAAIAAYETGESTSPINDLFCTLIERPIAGIIVEHGNALAKRVHEARARAWLRNNKYADPKNAPKPRRADGTYLRSVIAWSLVATPAAIKAWQYLCSLTNAYNQRATIIGLASIEYAKSKKVPANAWFDNALKSEIKGGDGEEEGAKKASVYIERIRDACAKWKLHHPKIASTYLSAITNSAKEAKTVALGVEAQLKIDAAAERKAAKKAGK